MQKKIKGLLLDRYKRKKDGIGKVPCEIYYILRKWNLILTCPVERYIKRTETFL